MHNSYKKCFIILWSPFVEGWDWGTMDGENGQSPQPNAVRRRQRVQEENPGEAVNKSSFWSVATLKVSNLTFVSVALQKMFPWRLRVRSLCPLSWPTGSTSTQKSWRSRRRTVPGLQSWLTTSAKTSWSSWRARSLSSSQRASSPLAATSRKLK